MARKAVMFDAVRKAGLRLAGVEESTMYGAPALKIRGKLVACMASHKSAEAGSLVVRIDFEQREELVAAEPDIYTSPITMSGIRPCWCDCLESVRTRWRIC